MEQQVEVFLNYILSYQFIFYILGVFSAALFRPILLHIGGFVSVSRFFVEKTSDLINLAFSKNRLKGTWEVVWVIEGSKNFEEINQKIGKISVLGNKFYSKTEGHLRDGATREYILDGEISGDGMILTGKWYDSVGKNTGYYGVFQLILNVNQDVAEGKWLGFSGDRSITRCGNMRWHRVS